MSEINESTEKSKQCKTEEQSKDSTQTQEDGTQRRIESIFDAMDKAMQKEINEGRTDPIEWYGEETWEKMQDTGMSWNDIEGKQIIEQYKKEKLAKMALYILIIIASCVVADNSGEDFPLFTIFTIH